MAGRFQLLPRAVGLPGGFAHGLEKLRRGDVRGAGGSDQDPSWAHAGDSVASQLPVGVNSAVAFAFLFRERRGIEDDQVKLRTGVLPQPIKCVGSNPLATAAR